MLEETKPALRRDLAKRRRAYIRREVENRGELTDDEIEEEAAKQNPPWPISSQSLKEDADYFDRHGLFIVRPKGEGKFVLSFPNSTYTYELRLRQSPREKEEIAELAAAILLGPPSKGRYTELDIFSMLDASATEYGANPATVAPIKEKLESYFRKNSRTCAIDAGTTTARLAEVLCEEAEIPNPESPLTRLTILTNCPRIARGLESTDTNIGVIVVGGRLRKSTAAFTGELTQRALDAWRIRLDAALVGTTSLNNYKIHVRGKTVRELEGFHCDSEEEGNTKSALLHHSTLRVVLMDASKCRKERSSAFPFCAVSPQHVDLVISDARIKEEPYRECLEALWKADVGVLIAKPKSHT